MKVFKWDEINGQDQDVKMEAFLTAINDTYAILQLKDEEETRPMHFLYILCRPAEKRGYAGYRSL